MNKLPLHVKLIYGLGGMGMNLCDMVFLQWIYVRYAPDEGKGTILLPAAALGAIIMAGRIGECFYNIGVGHWSDSCRSPIGRRIPFIRWGLIPLALVIFLMYVPPAGQPTLFYGVYMFILVQAYLGLYAVVVTPYLSLMPEMTNNQSERVALTISQSSFILLAQIIVTFIGVILGLGGWAVLAGVVAAVTVLALGPAAWILREQPREASIRKHEPGLFRSITLTLRNPAMFYIAGSTSLYWFSLNILIAIVPMWVKFVLNLGDSHVTYVMAPFLLMNVVGFVFFNALIKRFGKYPMFLFTLAASAACFALFAAVGKLPFGDPFLQTIVVTALTGLPVAGFMVIPFALLADAVDYDEQKTGHRREGMFFSVQGVFQKIFLGLSGVAFSQLAYWGTGTRVSGMGIRMAALAAAATSLAAFILFLGYPLRERDGKIVLAGR